MLDGVPGFVRGNTEGCDRGGVVNVARETKLFLGRIVMIAQKIVRLHHLDIVNLRRLQKVVLKAGQCLTVEPGLYYPGIGGARIEDVVIVEKAGRRILSRFSKQLEI